MNGSELPPRFQFAFRRMIFFLLCFCVWLVFGTLCFATLNTIGHRHKDNLKNSRIDAKRQELLNVLWAETISQSQNEWAEMANQKMEMYEKTLLSTIHGPLEEEERGFYGALRKAISLSTTIGPLDIDDFTMTEKLFAIMFTLIGAPLCLTAVTQYGRMVTSIWVGKSVLLPTSIFIFIAAIIYDIVEGGDDDVAFSDALFSIFLQFTTIGEEDNEFHGIFPYIICFAGLAFMSATIAWMQRVVERHLQSSELQFYWLFSGYERWMNESKESYNSNRIEEEDEEDCDY